MDIFDINEMLHTNFPTLESFEINSTWEKDIKGKSLRVNFIKLYPHKIDLNYISTNYKLNETTIRHIQNHVDWKAISSHQVLSENFIKEFKDKVDWYEISKKQKLTESFILEFREKINWTSISEFQVLSENFIQRFEDKLDWRNISRYQVLTDNFILCNIDKINWSYLTKNPTLSERIIEEHIEKFDFIDLMIYQNVPKTIINNHKKNIDWKKYFREIKKDNNLKRKLFELIDKYVEFIDWSTLSVLDLKISSNFINRYFPYIKWDEFSKLKLSEDIIREFYCDVNWKEISLKEYLTEDFIDEFQDKIDWESIGKNTEYSVPFLIKYKTRLKNAIICTNDISLIRELKNSIVFDKIDFSTFSEDLLCEFKEKIYWSYIIGNRWLSQNLIEQVCDCFSYHDWGLLCDSYALSNDFIRKNKDNVHWGGITRNQKLSIEFIDEFYDKLWTTYLIRYQNLSAEFLSKIWEKKLSLKNQVDCMKFQKNSFTINLLNTYSDIEKEILLGDSWLYKSTEFRKNKISQMETFECFENYFVGTTIADNNRYLPHRFHYKLDKDNTIETFAPEASDARPNGFPLGYFEHLLEFYVLTEIEKKEKFKPLKIKVYYDDVARIIKPEYLKTNINNNQIVICKRITIIE